MCNFLFFSILQRNVWLTDADDSHVDMAENAYHPIKEPFVYALLDLEVICVKWDSTYR